MKLDIRGENVRLGTQLREHVERRLGFALGRFADQVDDVSVRLADLNGDRGGLDKACRITVQLHPRGMVQTEEIDQIFEGAVNRGCERVARAVGRALERRREKKGRLPSRGGPTSRG